MTMTDTPTSAALEQRSNDPGNIVKRYEGSIATVLPSHVKPDQFVRIAQGVLRRDPKLAQVAQRNVGSFMRAVLDCATLGLEPGKTYHFVAYGSDVVGITDYKGEIELIYRAGAVASVRAEIVHRNDHFRWEPGAMDRPEHAPDWFGDRGDMVGVYAYAVMKDGSTSRVVMMSAADIDRVKAVSKTSKSSSSPWNQWPDRMWLKTAIHQLAKWVPTSAEYRETLMRSQAAANEVPAEIAGPVTVDYHDEDLPDDDEVVDAEVLTGDEDE